MTDLLARHRASRGADRRQQRRLRWSLLAGAMAMALVGVAALALTIDRSGEAGPDPAGVAGPTTPATVADLDPRPATRPPGVASRTRAHFPDAGTTGVPEGVTLTRSGAVAVHE